MIYKINYYKEYNNTNYVDIYNLPKMKIQKIPTSKIGTPSSTLSAHNPNFVFGFHLMKPSVTGIRIGMSRNQQVKTACFPGNKRKTAIVQTITTSPSVLNSSLNQPEASFIEIDMNSISEDSPDDFAKNCNSKIRQVFPEAEPDSKLYDGYRSPSTSESEVENYRYIIEQKTHVINCLNEEYEKHKKFYEEKIAFLEQNLDRKIILLKASEKKRRDLKVQIERLQEQNNKNACFSITKIISQIEISLSTKNTLSGLQNAIQNTLSQLKSGLLKNADITLPFSETKKMFISNIIPEEGKNAKIPLSSLGSSIQIMEYLPVAKELSLNETSTCKCGVELRRLLSLKGIAQCLFKSLLANETIKAKEGQIQKWLEESAQTDDTFSP